MKMLPTLVLSVQMEIYCSFLPLLSIHFSMSSHFVPFQNIHSLYRSLHSHLINVKKKTYLYSIIWASSVFYGTKNAWCVHVCMWGLLVLLIGKSREAYNFNKTCQVYNFLLHYIYIYTHMTNQLPWFVY